MFMPRFQTRLSGQGAHLKKEPGKWCATSCQSHSDFATRHIAPLGYKRSGFLVESAASQRHVEYFLVRLVPISELRVDLRGPPCGATDVQMVPGAEP